MQIDIGARIERPEKVNPLIWLLLSNGQSVSIRLRLPDP
jgi:hypothetical protein